MLRRALLGVIVGGSVFALSCKLDHIAGPGPGQGMVALTLTDAPTPLDSVAEVNVFIERIDARRTRADSSMRQTDIDEERWERREHRDSTLWVTIATPNAAFDLLTLQNGVTAFLGATPLDTGTFRSLRIVIDPARSTIVLKDGTVLSSTSIPPVEFESRHHHGLMVELDDSVEVHEGETTSVVLDLKLNVSLTLRGRTLRDGFLFQPVVVGRCGNHTRSDTN